MTQKELAERLVRLVEMMRETHTFAAAVREEIEGKEEGENAAYWEGYAAAFGHIIGALRAGIQAMPDKELDDAN